MLVFSIFALLALPCLLMLVLSGIKKDDITGGIHNREKRSTNK